MIVVRLLYTAVVMVVVISLLRAGSALGGLLIVPAAAVWLRPEAESGRLSPRVRRARRPQPASATALARQRARGARRAHVARLGMGPEDTVGDRVRDPVPVALVLE